jgi:hypothetical protein
LLLIEPAQPRVLAQVLGRSRSAWARLTRPAHDSLGQFLMLLQAPLSCTTLQVLIESHSYKRGSRSPLLRGELIDCRDLVGRETNADNCAAHKTYQTLLTPMRAIENRWPRCPIYCERIFAMCLRTARSFVMGQPRILSISFAVNSRLLDRMTLAMAS